MWLKHLNKLDDYPNAEIAITAIAVVFVVMGLLTLIVGQLIVELLGESV